MGNLWTRFKHKDARIILLGLDSAGKTSILYRLKLDDLITTIPTIGFNVESINYKDMHLTAWDIGSRDKIRPLFRHYYKGADAVVFVIDSHDPERLDELNYDVIKPAIGAEELTNAVFLFLANKMDLSNAMTTDDIAEKLGLRFLKHPWGIIPVSAVTGDGLQSALDWLAVRLGSSVVKPRSFAQPQPNAAGTASKPSTPLPRSPSLATSSPSNSSPATSRTNSSKGPVIMVNSRLYMDSRASPSSSPSLDRSSMSISPSTLPVRVSSSNFVNSFSSYSMAHSLREDQQTKRKLSNVSLSRADLRKLSCVSLNMNDPKNLSTVSLEDSPPQEEKKLPSATSSINLLSAPQTTPSSTSLLSISPKLDNNSLSPASSNQLGEGLSMSLSPKPPGQDLTLSGFGNFSHIMADYKESSRKDLDSSAKDSSSSSDSIPVSSPSEMIQPHLKSIGIKKPSFLSSSGKYVVNPTKGDQQQHPNSPPSMLRNLNQFQQTFTSNPENSQYGQISSSISTGAIVDASSKPQSHHPPRPRCLGNKQNKTNVHSNILSSQALAHSVATVVPSNKKRWKVYSKSTKQSSEDSSNSSSSSPSTSNRRSTLDLFCTPSRRSITSFSPSSSPQEHRQRNATNNDNNMAVIPVSSTRGAYCSRAYSAMKCLFFRPTKREMQDETNSISSDDDNDDRDDNDDIHDNNDDLVRGEPHPSEIGAADSSVETGGISSDRAGGTSNIYGSRIIVTAGGSAQPVML